jgi:hypothetical protein
MLAVGVRVMRKLAQAVRDVLAFPFTKPMSWAGAALVILAVVIIILLILPSCAST